MLQELRKDNSKPGCLSQAGKGKRPKTPQKLPWICWKMNGFGQHLDNRLIFLRDYKTDDIEGSFTFVYTSPPLLLKTTSVI